MQTAGGATSTGGVLPADVTRGAVLFENTCGNDSCHGSDGVVGPAPSLTGLPYRSDEDLRLLFAYGRPAVGMSSGMPAQRLSEQETVDVLAYLRVTFGEYVGSDP
jgi:mono/diheme cytochrome c family protein